MKKWHWFAGLASFFIVGSGQLLKGEGDKGLKLILAFYFILPGLVYSSLLFNGTLFVFTLGLAIILGLLLWLYNTWDALKHAPLD